MHLDEPSITIIIPTLNEEGFIGDCIQSLVLGSYPIEKIEVLVVDGDSTDNTKQEVTKLKLAGLDLRLLENPKKIAPSAMNIGVANAKHELLMWCGAHAVYDHDYVKLSVQTIVNTPHASSVGGVIRPIAKTRMGNAIALATSSKFGIGNAQYRYATARQEVDTVFGGCFRKSDVLKIGGFNEEWIRNQDYEFNFRLRTQIGPIVLEPTIQCQYYCRESLEALAKQYLSYGFWRYNTLKSHPSSFTYRQAAPVLLCSGLAFSLIGILLGYSLFWLMPALYIAASTAVAVNIALKENKAILAILLPAVFATLHISWGTGFLKNFLSSTYKKLTFNQN